MDKPIVADNKPVQVTLEEGKTYYFCACGRSEKQPFCDGSHRGTDFVPLKFTADKTRGAWLCACKQTRTAPFCNGAHRHVGADRIGDS